MTAEKYVTLLPAQVHALSRLVGDNPQAISVVQDGSLLTVSNGKGHVHINAKGELITFLKKREKK